MSKTKSLLVFSAKLGVSVESVKKESWVLLPDLARRNGPSAGGHSS